MSINTLLRTVAVTGALKPAQQLETRNRREVMAPRQRAEDRPSWRAMTAAPNPYDTKQAAEAVTRVLRERWAGEGPGQLRLQ